MGYRRQQADLGSKFAGIRFGELTLPENLYPWRTIVFECLNSYDRPDSFHYTAKNHYFIDPDTGDDTVSILPAIGSEHPEILIGTTPVLETIHAFIGSALDVPAVTVFSDGVTAEVQVEKAGGGDVRIIFSDGTYLLDCTPILEASLTLGSDTSPTLNYVYVLQSTKLLTISTSGWPVAEHAPIATVYCQSATDIAASGPYKMHAWTDHLHSVSQGPGHISDINKWIRSRPAGWLAGGSLTPTGGVSTIHVAVSAATIIQLHEHAFPAFDTSGSSDVYVVNNAATPYNKITNQYAETDDSAGVALKSWYSLVYWGVVSQDSGDCKLMVNLPSGSYTNNAGDKAINDNDAFASYDIPPEFAGTGFLIAKVTYSRTGSTITVEDNTDLRGSFPGSTAGSTGGVLSTEFVDNVFRIQAVGDNTAKIAFDGSAIATGTVRTIFMQDEDIILIDWQDAIEDFWTTGSVSADEVILTGGTGTQGTLSWNADEETLDLICDGATLQLGQEFYMHVRNQTGVTINEGEAVMAAGTLGASGRILIAPMDGTDPANAKFFIGIATEIIETATDGKITTQGKVRGIDTTGTPVGEVWSEGDVLWISPDTAGELTNVEPDPTEIGIPCAFIINKHATTGTLAVRVTGVDEHRLVQPYLFIPEVAAASADVAAFGQIWVKNDTPNVLMFTDDAGTDWNLLAGGGGPTDSLFLTEQAAAQADVAGSGQWWVKNDAPNTPMFTDDVGNDRALDFQVEGTWSPQVSDDSLVGTEGTYTRQDGRYTLIGDLVFFWLDVQLNTFGTMTTTDDVWVSVPFVSESGMEWAATVGYATDLSIGVDESVVAEIQSNKAWLQLRKWDATDGPNAMTVAEFTDQGRVRISGVYRRA